MNNYRVSVSRVAALSEEVEGLLISLNYLVGLIIQAGQERFDAEGYLIKDGILYLKWYKLGYLALNPAGKNATEQHFYVDCHLVPKPELFSIDVLDLQLVAIELENLLIMAEVIEPGSF